MNLLNIVSDLWSRKPQRSDIASLKSVQKARETSFPLPSSPLSTPNSLFFIRYRGRFDSRTRSSINKISRQLNERPNDVGASGRDQGA